MRKMEVPKFRSETEEAEWWFRNRQRTAQWMEDAVAARKTTTLGRVLERARKRPPSTSASIRIDGADAARLRSLAARRGLPYQAYLKKLLRQALDREERRITL